MREQWLLTHDNDDSVATGTARTARPITAAALITAVSGCFLIAGILELKEFGFALAAAVILDATLVRLLLVPAFMKFAGGTANWWRPHWLGRIPPGSGSNDLTTRPGSRDLAAQRCLVQYEDYHEEGEFR